MLKWGFWPPKRGCALYPGAHYTRQIRYFQKHSTLPVLHESIRKTRKRHQKEGRIWPLMRDRKIVLFVPPGAGPMLPGYPGDYGVSFCLWEATPPRFFLSCLCPPFHLNRSSMPWDSPSFLTDVWQRISLSNGRRYWCLLYLGPRPFVRISGLAGTNTIPCGYAKGITFVIFWVHVFVQKSQS